MSGIALAVEVVRKSYHPHVSTVDTLVAGFFTFFIVAAVLFVRYRVSKEMKKRGIKGDIFRRRKKTHK